ncbi:MULTISPECIES: hypothetical protein [unclassified Streptomyces]|nr:hypothetical protein [Streptomyces sp. CB09001]
MRAAGWSHRAPPPLGEVEAPLHSHNRDEHVTVDTTRSEDLMG